MLYPEIFSISCFLLFLKNLYIIVKNHCRDSKVYNNKSNQLLLKKNAIIQAIKLLFAPANPVNRSLIFRSLYSF